MTAFLAPAQAAGIVLDRVHKQFALNGQPLEVLRGIEFSIEPGRFISIVGASGCGKSTLLRLIVGLERPDQGAVYVDKRRVEGPAVDLGIVFQDHRLFPWLSLEANVGLALERSSFPVAARRTRVLEYLDLVGLAAYRTARPSQISGGMAQRAAIARALVTSPKVLLLDEPFSALDSLTRYFLQDELLRIWRQTGATVVLVTHNIEEAVYLSDQVVILDRNPGRLEQIVPIDLSRPRRHADTRLAELKSQILSYFDARRLDSPRDVAPSRIAHATSDHSATHFG
jgi:ABC-type nitrate/sulfonate/bicarbonate transport system ATPase subunit